MQSTDPSASTPPASADTDLLLAPDLTERRGPAVADRTAPALRAEEGLPPPPSAGDPVKPARGAAAPAGAPAGAGDAAEKEPGPPVLAMAVATGIAVGTMYFNQPMLGLIEREFPGGLAGLIPTVTQLGYAAGLFFLVPLGDMLERRRLIVGQFVALAVALALTAAAPSVALLVLASALLGISATAAQQIIPFAARLAPPARRGQVVGTVMAGLLAGILLSRTVAGAVAGLYGWRAIYAISVVLSLAMVVVMARALPRSRPEAGGIGYPALLRSLFSLWREFPALRLAALTQAMLFGGFSAFWTILALYLQTPRFGLGPAAAGLFGVVGLVGVTAAPLAGRLADRTGPQLVVAAGASVTLLAWLAFGLWGTIAGLVVGVVVLDFGVQSALVSNQHLIYSLRPEARSRLNTVFMTGMFLGGALGSALASVAWQAAAWPGVVTLGAAMAVLAVLAQVAALRHHRRG